MKVKAKTLAIILVLVIIGFIGYSYIARTSGIETHASSSIGDAKWTIVLLDKNGNPVELSPSLSLFGATIYKPLSFYYGGTEVTSLRITCTASGSAKGYTSLDIHYVVTAKVQREKDTFTIDISSNNIIDKTESVSVVDESWSYRSDDIVSLSTILGGLEDGTYRITIIASITVSAPDGTEASMSSDPIDIVITKQSSEITIDSVELNVRPS